MRRRDSAKRNSDNTPPRGVEDHKQVTVEEKPSEVSEEELEGGGEAFSLTGGAASIVCPPSFFLSLASSE